MTASAARDVVEGPSLPSGWRVVRGRRRRLALLRSVRLWLRDVMTRGRW